MVCVLKQLVAFVLGIIVGGGGMLIYQTFVRK
jgi:hypothetical protein